MIINTGSRTDIPAYFSRWFYKRIEEGYVMTRNPFYPQQVIKYRLDPAVVDCLMFCTKNPEPMLARLDELRDFRQCWFVTITPYGRDVEPWVPDKTRVMDAFRRLSELVGAGAVGWRYDPIFINDTYTLEFHMEQFERMAAYLSGYTHHCVISFIDLYAKTRRNFPGVREVSAAQREQIGQCFADIGKRYGMLIRTCCEGTELEKYGIDCSGCMTQPVVEQAIGVTLNVPGKHSTRAGCDCLIGNDIGMYNTCGHGCLYCYANDDRKLVEQNMKLHDINSPFLVGGLQEGDKIKEARQVSWLDGQMRLF